jgi:hypothetical protein
MHGICECMEIPIVVCGTSHLSFYGIEIAFKTRAMLIQRNCKICDARRNKQQVN